MTEQQPTEAFHRDDPPLVVVGQTGQRGAVGRPGQPGPVGPSSVLSATQVIALFVFVLGVFLILAWRINMQTQELSEATHRHCVQSQANGKSLNNLLDQVIVATRTRSDLPASVRADYIAKYMAAKPVSLDCGEAP